MRRTYYDLNISIFLSIVSGQINAYGANVYCKVSLRWKKFNFSALNLHYLGDLYYPNLSKIRIAQKESRFVRGNERAPDGNRIVIRQRRRVRLFLTPGSFFSNTMTGNKSEYISD